MSCTYKAVVLIVSTKGAKGEREDLVGPLLHKKLADEGYRLEPTVIVPDDRALIAAQLCRLVDDEKIDLVVTSGGTGLSPSDVTPEATEDILDRAIPGLAEAMRAAGRVKTPHADLSRGLVGQRRSALIINLPGSPNGALEGLASIIPSLFHAIDKIKGDPSDCAINYGGGAGAGL